MELTVCTSSRDCVELTVCTSSSSPDPHVESDKLSPSQFAADTSFVRSFSAGPSLGLSSRSSEFFKSLKDMSVSESFISTASFKHFVCVCSCFPEFGTKL